MLHNSTDFGRFPNSSAVPRPGGPGASYRTERARSLIRPSQVLGLRHVRFAVLTTAKVVVYLVAFVLLLVVIGIGLLETGWAKNKIRELMVRQANQYLTVSLGIGRLGGCLFRGIELNDVTLSRDGHPISSAEWGVKVPVDGGEHVVEARAPGHEPWSTRINAPAKHGAQHTAGEGRLGRVQHGPAIDLHRVASAASAGSSAPASVLAGRSRWNRSKQTNFLVSLR